MTPRSTRGSTGRSNSVGSSVNSCEDNEVIELNESSKNIYADIDECGFATNKSADEDMMPPALPADNVTPREKLNILQVSTINELDSFEECFENDFQNIPNKVEDNLNGSKNNLLLIDDPLMTGSIDGHLDNIDLINKSLDKLMQSEELIESEETTEAAPEAIKEKKKIAEKMKFVKESPSTSGESSKDSFASRVKNIFPRFEKQVSEDDQAPSDEKAGKISKKFLSPFKKKQQPIVDETEEVFEEIKHVPSDKSIKDADGMEKEVEEKSPNLPSKLKSKLMLNIKTAKHAMTSRMARKCISVEHQICKICSKRFGLSPDGITRLHHSKLVLDFTKSDSELTFDNEFCVCVNVDDLFGDDGICIKNFEYRDVSQIRRLYFRMEFAWSLNL